MAWGSCHWTPCVLERHALVILERNCPATRAMRCHAIKHSANRCVRNATLIPARNKLGFLNMAKRANAHCANKNTAIKALRRVSDVCQTLVQKCDAHKALICAIGADDGPLASRRPARLIATGQSAAAVLEDLSKAIQIRSYNETEAEGRQLEFAPPVSSMGTQMAPTASR